MSEQESLLQNLLEDIYRIYGYDFREYSKSSAWRRVSHRMALSDTSSLSDFRQKISQDPVLADQLIKDFSINVTEMFRDPDFFAALRHQVLPHFIDLPFIKIWHAGCATGEEAYSMAIILSETGLYERTKIFATDFNPAALDQKVVEKKHYFHSP